MLLPRKLVLFDWITNLALDHPECLDKNIPTNIKKKKKKKQTFN